jgi:hypothetical protein
MALGNAMPGQKFKALVATFAAPTVFMPIGKMNNFRLSSQSNEAEFDTWDSDDPIVFAGKKRRSITLSGFLADADDGQTAILDAEVAKETVILKFFWDGTTNGFTQEANVSAYQGEASAGNPGAPISFSVDFKPTTAEGTVIAAGPLL